MGRALAKGRERGKGGEMEGANGPVDGFDSFGADDAAEDLVLFTRGSFSNLKFVP